MNDKIYSKTTTTVSVNDKNQQGHIIKIGKALSVRDRIRILDALSAGPMNLYEISLRLSIPIGSVARHIDALLDAQLIFITYIPGPKGHIKQCSNAVFGVGITINDSRPPEKQIETVEMPIGMYSDFKVTAPCGMTGTSENDFTVFDDPSVFYSPDRMKAENLWFNTGYVNYYFPLKKNLSSYSMISFSFEVCSECICYNTKWPSDITLTINGKDVVTFTSPGDFGGRRGDFTPDFWPLQATQYGILKMLTIDKKGVLFDHKPIKSDINIDNLAAAGNFIKFGIGVKDDATHRGGINLFGKRFGDYPQAIIMKLYSEDTI